MRVRACVRGVCVACVRAAAQRVRGVCVAWPIVKTREPAHAPTAAAVRAACGRACALRVATFAAGKHFLCCASRLFSSRARRALTFARRAARCATARGRNRRCVYA